MKFISDEKLPFTCEITKEFCGGGIKSLYISLEEELMTSIPVSNDISELVKPALIRKIRTSIVNLIKEDEKRSRKKASIKKKVTY